MPSLFSGVTAPTYDDIRWGGPDGLRLPQEVGKATLLSDRNSEGPVMYFTAAGAIPTGASKLVVLNGSSALAMTLAAPVAGQVGAGGSDGITIVIVAFTAHAHTVTTPANTIWGTKDTVTFAAEGDIVELTAVNGIWMVRYLGGPTPASLSEV